MKLAREFHRPDWRAMLAGMTSSELEQWHEFYQENHFSDALLDAHFAALNLTVFTLACGENDLTPGHFSLLSPALTRALPEPDEDHDEKMMALAEGVHGGVRYGPVSG
ncbi:phage tail assembly protein T [Pantoea cypripedii]|uniref:Phage tail assembly protein T n=1 Tax=Pantoea cypripedii TaxID=55209 RepID=A0A1X1ET11_PANCY|nr:phage tail assembly protein T [Pantoea cypripedii]ORM93149.1 phage tail assembly protein T [Pantoea cypripedii]